MKLRPASQLIALGRPQRVPGMPLNVPPNLASTFFAGSDRSYARDNGSPSWEAFEEVAGALEGGSAVSFASGIAACAAVLSVQPWKRIVIGRGYMGVAELVQTHARERGIPCALADTNDAAQTIAACDDATLLWLERPTNPLLELPDLERIIPQARERGAIVAVDNTFATPLLQQPLHAGAHFSVHSGTKYLSGHSDATIGIAVTNSAQFFNALLHHRDLHGAIPGAMETYLTLRGMRTLGLRLERAQQNARILAERLTNDARVASVRYPGFGAMIAFEIPEGAVAADAFCNALTLAVHSTSLGGVETTLERRSRYPAEAYLPAGFIRMSTGCEDAEDLWTDLQSALNAVTQG